jgi:isoquinoline 1-oxidoreductase beta subunit
MTLIKTKYNRRSFIKVSTAASGGLVLGFSWLASCTPSKTELLEMPEAWFDINAFLKIGDNGVVTIMSPNPEIGQNVKTSMPMIVAEELDVDWKNVIVEQAGLNTEKYKRQIAGGSQSIRQGWESLRMAGATARHMLLQAASQQLEIPVKSLTVENGIISDGNGKSTSFGEVAAIAATLEVPEEVALKDPKDFKIIGKATKNVDGKQIVTGKPLFGLDYKVDGMLTAMLIHPPAFGMTIKSIDDSMVKDMPGIKGVAIIDAYPEDLEKTWSDGNHAFPKIAVVVGSSTWEVMNAKKVLRIEWERTSKGENTRDHIDGLTKLIAEKADEASRVDGDPYKAFDNADRIIERTYTAPFLAHNTMEPMNFFAHVTADKAELVGPVQTPENLRTTAAKLCGLEEDKVNVMMTRMGGGFGRRLYGNFGIEAAAISKHFNAPIKLVYTREDDMTQGVYRPAYKVLYRAAIDADNKVTGIHIRGAGIDGSPVFSNRFPAGTIDNYLVENYSLESNVSTGAWRAPRSNFIAGAEQSFLDELAEEIGKDPVEFRLELFERGIKSPVGERNDYDAERYAGVIKLVKEKANWGQEQAGVHRGFAAYYCHNSYVAQVLDIEMVNGTPSIKKVYCAVDCGIVVNPVGAKNQIEGGIIDGVGHAMYSNISLSDGVPNQSNFDSYRLIRHNEAPKEIETFFVENEIDPTGLGEPGLPPAIGALANALYKATGRRYYNQPFMIDEHELGLRNAI